MSTTHPFGMGYTFTENRVLGSGVNRYGRVASRKAM